MKSEKMCMQKWKGQGEVESWTENDFHCLWTAHAGG